jgi:hypothetical protein
MIGDECRCGFKIPPVSTVEIKKVGAQETNFPLPINDDVAKLFSQCKLTGRPYAEVCMDYCREVLRKAKARNEFERLQRRGQKC